MQTWLIVGASRGIGLEFVNQLLARHDTFVYAVARNPSTSGLLETVRHGKENRCRVLQCDITDEESIMALVKSLAGQATGQPDNQLKLDYCVFNAGVLQYPGRATEMTFKTFNHHLMTNTVGPVVLAASLLKYHSKELLLSNLTFISSDSGSQGNFLSYENGFAAYGASKSALNMSIRHMAHELKVSGRGELSVFALHPGEVATDMAEVEVPWEVNGVLSPEESVKGCLQTIAARKPEESGTFWTWKAEQYPW